MTHRVKAKIGLMENNFFDILVMVTYVFPGQLFLSWRECEVARSLKYKSKYRIIEILPSYKLYTNNINGIKSI